MTLPIRPGRDYSQKEQLQILTDIDNRITDLERALNNGNYIIAHLGDGRVRSLDVNTASLDDLRKFVATLVTDFKTAGRLK